MNAIGVKRTYADFAGVDFMNDSTFVLPNRSPDALNVWKNYTDEKGGCIETRPGFKNIANFSEKILGIYIWSPGVAIVHAGTNLYKWSNFPNTPIFPPNENATVSILSSYMSNTQKSVFNKFKDKLYINDGSHYLYYDGVYYEAEDATTGTVPITSIGRSPSGGGEKYQEINLLSIYRTNSFVGDGTSTDYYLDATAIQSVSTVVVNGTTISTGYTVDTTNGKVTFSTAPSAPVDGKDNVQITYRKTVSGYADRIRKCTKAVMWDNRMFFTGNPDYPNVIFHSELNDPQYVSDLSYYEDGAGDSPIKDIVVGADVLWVFKYVDQDNANVFYHTKTIDDEQGAVYPAKQGNVSVGCYSNAVNYKDDILYLSLGGVEGIQTSELDSRQIIAHRSTLVDPKLINSSNYESASFCEYKGYLLVLCGGKVFLADGRQKFANQDSFEYEWYYWDIGVASPNLLKEYDGDLYIGATDGKIYHFEGTNDAGEILESYWTTIMDNFGYDNKMKTTSKRGGTVRVKTIPNGLIKVGRRSNKYEDYRYITEKSLDGFDFVGLDFSNWSFTTTSQSYIVFKIKEKKINEISLKVYSDEKDKPFGLYSITLEAFVGSYIKK